MLRIAGLLVLVLLAALAGAMPAAAHAGHARMRVAATHDAAPPPAAMVFLAGPASRATCAPACGMPVEMPCCPSVACAHATALALATATVAHPWRGSDDRRRSPLQALPSGRSPEQPTPPPRLPA